MFKTLATFAVLGFAFSAPARAAEMTAKCDDATMKMIHEAMVKDTAPKMANDVKMAGGEMKKAESAMKAHKMDECTKHVGMAMDHMMIKHK